MSGKVGDVQQTKWYTQKVPFYDDHYVYQASELQPVIDKQSGTCRRHLLLQGLCVPRL